MKRLLAWKTSQPILLASLLGLCLAAAGVAAIHGGAANTPVTMKLAAPAPSNSTGYASTVKKVFPTVVSIVSTKSSKASAQTTGDLEDNPLFRQFFGDQSRQRERPERRERGLGSGVVLSPDGYIVTNNHVVDGATGIRVTLADKREFKATLVGADSKSDIAVLKIDAKDLPAITVGDSSMVQVGDIALAIGNPFGVGQTLTMGVVSATGRSHLGIEEYEDFIQTDAAINPGNSGGALVNDRGELIGINTAILSHGSGGNQGIGFAVPINMARNAVEQLVKTGKVTRAYLGIVPQDVTPAIAKAFGEKEARGALVGDISPDGPARKSGLQQGDIIREVNGKPIADSNGLRMAISMMQPDTNVNLKVSRNGSTRDIAVKLAELPSSNPIAKNDAGRENNALSGVSVDNLDTRTAAELKLSPSDRGVVVTKVNPSSDAANAGLRRGDVIQEVNRKPVSNVSEFENAAGRSKEETVLLVNRSGHTFYIAV
jgi:serine protease Do